jgi:hypothetical protein
MKINKSLAESGASTQFEFPLWTLDSGKNPIEISRFSTLANEFPLYAIDTAKMTKVLNYIKNFTPYEVELLHNLAMCNKSVFLYANPVGEPGTPKPKKGGAKIMVYLYKKLFAFIEDIIANQDGPFGDEEMTQGADELSTQSRLNDADNQERPRPGEERLEHAPPLRNVQSEPLVPYFFSPLKFFFRRLFLRLVRRKFAFGTRTLISRRFTMIFATSMMSMCEK